jgi:glutaredoxin-related protein
MKIRFFGSPSCKDCLKIFVLLEKYNVNYEYFDGHDIDDDYVYDMCEDQNINELPHLQIIDNKNNVIVEHIGPIEESEFVKIVGLFEK